MHQTQERGRVQWRPRRLAASLAALGLAAATMIASVGTATTAAAAVPQVINIAQTTTGTSLTPSSVGLSFEASSLSLPGFTSGNLATYEKTLGTSVMRIGANAVDRTFWTSTGETAPSWATDGTITPVNLTSLAGLAQASGWKVILAVNLKHYDPARAADEAAHAKAALGSSLLALEIGNEPDLYPQYTNNTAQYISDFQNYVAAINQAAPGVPIEATDVATSPTGTMQNAFVSYETGLGTPNISELTSHYYPLKGAGCGGTSSISDLLGTTTRTNELNNATSAVSQAARLGVPAVIDEGNSAYCGGQPGVSDVFAAALWEIDHQLVNARQGVQGVYEHGGVKQCGTTMPYTPLCALTATDAANGKLAAQPEFYGLATVAQIGTGDFLNVDNPAWANVRAYAVKHTDGTETVVLDNVQDPAVNGPTTLQLNLGASFASGTRMDLTASSLSATSGITLGGQTIQPDGTLPTPTTTGFGIGGNSFNVTVPAGSATLLTLTPSTGSTTTTFVGGLSGKCLSVTGASTADGATAEIWTCNGSPSENWTVNPNGTIIGGLSGKCLEVTGSSIANFAGVDISICNGAANQQWTVNADGTIVGVQSGKCLSVLGAATTNGATADIYTCNGSPSENWTKR
ncbi:glycosyl hydrolase family protein [Streptomyces sp. NPDC001978]|uniref:glycosyl hydrolase family protein n=1 Tax=Streptomyces sp. NPDC001978 TaxID=3364627 RepID=UPI0036987F3E